MKLRILEVKLKYFIWALQMSFKPNPNYLAEYNGKLYGLHNQVFDEKIWTLIAIEDSKSINHVNVKNFKTIIPDFDSFKIRFNEMYRFQMQSWYQIDCRKPLGKRISYYNSSNIQFG